MNLSRELLCGECWLSKNTAYPSCNNPDEHFPPKSKSTDHPCDSDSGSDLHKQIDMFS